MNTDNKIHRLFWIGHTGRRIPAGVAFYNEKSGDYRLKVDTFSEDKAFFLKAVGANEESINFRVESLLRKPQGIPHRVEVGYGFSNSKTGYPIHISIGPYEKTLLLEEAA